MKLQSGVSVSGPSGLRFCFRVVVFSVPDFVFFVILGSFLGGYPPPGPPFQAKGCRRTPQAAQRPCFDGFRWIWGSIWEPGAVVFRTFRRLFFGVFWVRFRGRFSMDFGSILGGISESFGFLFGDPWI